jgi:hypothetical protein
MNPEILRVLETPLPPNCPLVYQEALQEHDSREITALEKLLAAHDCLFIPRGTERKIPTSAAKFGPEKWRGSAVEVIPSWTANFASRRIPQPQHILHVNDNLC